MADKRTTKASSGFTDVEKAAMKQRAAETRPRRGRTTPEEDLAEVLARFAAMSDDDRAIAERIHELVLKAAPGLAPKTWYGMAAYYKDGKVICFFQDAGKFKTRYCTFGFQDSAALDDGSFWPTSYAVEKVTPAVAKQITALVKKAVG